MADNEVTLMLNISPELRKEIINVAGDKGMTVDRYIIEAITDQLNRDKAVSFAEQTVGRGEVSPEEAAEVLREFIAASAEKEDMS